MGNRNEIEQLYEIAASIKKAGYDPYEQLYGYVTTGLDLYVTRTGDARNKIKSIPVATIREFLKNIQ